MTDQPVPAARPRRPLGVVVVAATQLLRAGLIVGQFLELHSRRPGVALGLGPVPRADAGHPRPT